MTLVGDQMVFERLILLVGRSGIFFKDHGFEREQIHEFIELGFLDSGISMFKIEQTKRASYGVGDRDAEVKFKVLEMINIGDKLTK